MASKYSIAEARARLPLIVNQTEAGGHVELTRRGKPVAVVISTREFDRLRGGRKQFREAFQDFAARFDLDKPGEKLGVSRTFAASLRDPSPGRDVKL